MINKNLLRPNRDDIFGQNIPMRQSIVITENVLFLDLDKSESTIRKRSERRTEVFETRKSSIVISSIAYPSHNFLARKIKRVIQFHLQQSFNKIKSHRIPKVNLNLLQSTTKRLMASAFFSIQLLSRIDKGSKLEGVIQKNKKPVLLFHAVGRVLKERYKQVVEKIKRQQSRRTGICGFINLLDNLVRVQMKKYYKKVLFIHLKNNYNAKEMKLNGVNNVCKLLPKIIRRIKNQSFYSIFSCLKRQQLEQVSALKKDFTYKINETTSERSKALNSHRQSIRNIKNDLDYFSADRSKARYEIRREIGVQKNKLKQEQKKAKIRTNELAKQINEVDGRLESIKWLNSKRLQRLKSPVNEQSVRKLYLSIHCQQQNKVGEIKPKILTKAKLSELQDELQKLDEYHIFLNQKLRQQISQYEGIVVYSERWPQEQVVYEQNMALKQLMRCLVGRSLQKAAVPIDWQDSGK